MTNKTTSRWSAVSIVAGNNSCEAAHALKGQRFLSTEAPRLPLAGCKAAQTCRCVYRKYADRRAGPRRAEEQGSIRRSPSGGSERRAGRGRRSTDA